MGPADGKRCFFITLIALIVVVLVYGGFVAYDEHARLEKEEVRTTTSLAVASMELDALRSDVAKEDGVYLSPASLLWSEDASVSVGEAVLVIANRYPVEKRFSWDLRGEDGSGLETHVGEHEAVLDPGEIVEYDVVLQSPLSFGRTTFTAHVSADGEEYGNATGTVLITNVQR